LVACLAITAGFIAINYTSASADPPLITGAQVQDDSLTGDDVLESSLAEVPQAAQATTAAGLIQVVRVDVAPVEVSPNAEAQIEAKCPAGFIATGGGYFVSGGETHTNAAYRSLPESFAAVPSGPDVQGWWIRWVNTEDTTQLIYGRIMCVRSDSFLRLDTTTGQIPVLP
jgi:hypothetical protein